MPLFMKKSVYFFIIILIIGSIACKKKKDVLSSSKYKDATLIFGRGKIIYRDSLGIDSIDYYASAGAGFGEGYDEQVKHVLLNSEYLYGPVSPFPTVPYLRDWDNSNHKFDTAKWEVISTNDVIDMSHAISALPYYSENVPYNVSLSTNLTFTIDAMLYSDADSIKIEISDLDRGPDTTVNITATYVTFSVSQLSKLSYNANFHKGRLTIYIFKKSTYIEGGRNYHIENGSFVQYDINIKP